MCQHPNMTITTTVNSLGALLRVWRETAGLNLPELAARASGLLPVSHSVSRSTLNRYELDNFPAKGPDPLVLSAIAEACGRRQNEIPEQYRMQQSMMEILRNRCFPVKAQCAA
jgi:transcriptional regulator with XRE-family HTH domain